MKKITHNHNSISWIAGFLAAAILLSGCTAAGNSSGQSQGSSGTDDSRHTETSSDLSPVSRQSFYFDTICQVTIYAIDEETFNDSGLSASEASSREGETDTAAGSGGSSLEDRFKADANDIIDHSFSLCSEYESLLSKTVEGSDIWNVNHASGKPVQVDSRTIEIVKKGIEYGDLSGGKFDITIGKAEDLWDFHSDNPNVPDSSELAEAVSHVNYKTIQLDESAGTISLDDPEAEIDLGGIAKGYIADRLCDQLSSDGVTAAIVSLGGNIECVGGKPSENGFISKEDAAQTAGNFRIGVETPYSHETRISGVTPLNNGTMVTSGVYERYFEENGVQYHHILDPANGYPVDTDVLGVTIQSSEDKSVDCDALATICLIYGSPEGEKLIESMDGYEAVFILTDNTIIKTPGMDFTASQ